MKVVITGGEGFIGKALAAALYKRGAEVISIDRTKGIEAKDFFDTVPNLHEADCVYHLAAQTSVFNTNHAQIMYDNIETFMAVCNACKRAGVKLVYASSSTANSPNTTSLYGISKRFDEEYARCYDPHATGVRLHNVYGPNPRQGTLLWHLLHDNPVKLVNGGRNVRHFTYIDDVIEGLIYAWGCNYSLINIANPEKTSVYDFALAVQAHNEAEISLLTEKREFDKIAQTVDDSLFTVPLPYTPVKEGIRRVFDTIDNDTAQ